MPAAKCRVCNNPTLRPSGFCHLHESASQFDDIIKGLDIGMSKPPSGSSDVTSGMYELGRMYNQDLPDPGPDRKKAVRERIERGEAIAEELGYPPGFRVTHDGDAPFCMRPITDNARGIAHTINVEGADEDLSHDPIKRFVNSDHYRVWLTEMAIPKAEDRGTGKTFDPHEGRDYVRDWEIDAVLKRANVGHSEIRAQGGRNDYYFEVYADDLDTTLNTLSEYVMERK